VQANEPAVGHWDPMRLEQVVSNLLSNAIKFGEGRPIELTVTSSRDQARLAIRDHGIGVAPERLPHIFERFERGVSSRQYGGLGLGLYIVRSIVEGMGGGVRCEPTPGGGSTFLVDLPHLPHGAPSGPVATPRTRGEDANESLTGEGGV
jgi:signal transduction histidine kinase